MLHERLFSLLEWISKLQNKKMNKKYHDFSGEFSTGWPKRNQRSKLKIVLAYQLSTKYLGQTWQKLQIQDLQNKVFFKKGN